MGTRVGLVLLLGLLGSTPALAGGICKGWTEPYAVGALDHAVVNEASGMAVSRQYTDRMYFHNDSGDGPFLYVTDGRGKLQRRVEIEGGSAIDNEDLGLGPCGDRTCLFIGDIGDNFEMRSTIEVVVVEELREFPARVAPLAKLQLRYPDGPHNAEGLAVHPNGDLYVLTKEMSTITRVARAAKLYRLPRSEWGGPGAGNAHLLQAAGEIDLPFLADGASKWGKIVTAFDIAPDGSKFIALTYERAYEFGFDLAVDALIPAREMAPGQDYFPVKVLALDQQEALSYLPDGRGLVYTTEVEKKKKDPPLMRMDCLD